ncbi:MAG: hypothetical protein RSG77_14940 [Hafnia sp.]
MKKELMWSADTCVRSGNVNSLKDVLTKIDGLSVGDRYSCLGELILTSMVHQNNAALDELLKHTDKDCFPAKSISDGLQYYVDPGNHEKIDKMLRLLSYHKDKLTPNLKATVGFELAAYVSDDTYAWARKNGIMDASESCHARFRLHGLRDYSVLRSERIAELVAEMPEESKADFYNMYLTDGAKTMHLNPSFLKEAVKDDALFAGGLVKTQPFSVHIDHLNDPEYALALVQRNVLGRDYLISAVLRNREDVPIVKAVVEKLDSLKAVVSLDSPSYAEGALRFCDESVGLLKNYKAEQLTPAGKQNADLVITKLKECAGVLLRHEGLSDSTRKVYSHLRAGGQAQSPGFTM